jgi:hypothetical protein
MALYLNGEETRLLDLLCKIYDRELPPFTDELMRLLKCGRTSLEDISYYIACVNPRVYGKYFSLSRKRLNSEVIKKTKLLLPEILFSSLSQDERADVLITLQDHADIICHFINTGEYLRKSTTPFMSNEVYFLNGRDVIVADKHTLVTRICNGACVGDECVKDCVRELSSLLRVEKTLHSFSSRP